MRKFYYNLLNYINLTQIFRSKKEEKEKLLLMSKKEKTSLIFRGINDEETNFYFTKILKALFDLNHTNFSIHKLPRYHL